MNIHIPMKTNPITNFLHKTLISLKLSPIPTNLPTSKEEQKPQSIIE